MCGALTAQGGADGAMTVADAHPLCVVAAELAPDAVRQEQLLTLDGDLPAAVHARSLKQLGPPSAPPVRSSCADTLGVFMCRGASAVPRQHQSPHSESNSRLRNISVTAAPLLQKMTRVCLDNKAVLQ